MRIFLAVIFPWLLFFTIKRPIAGAVCLLLQFTAVGWIPAAFWAVHALGQFKTDKKIDALKTPTTTGATAVPAETATGEAADPAETAAPAERPDPGP